MYDRWQKLPEVMSLIAELDSEFLHLPLDSLFNEIEEIHQKRLIQKPDITKSLTLKRSHVNQAYRSRLVQIQMHAFRRRTLLQARCNEVKNLILAKYGSQLKQTRSTINERETYVNGFLIKVLSRIQDFETLEDYAEIAISDIDQAAFVNKNTLDTLNSATKSREVY